MSKEAVLCVGNFRASTGYAWNFINALYAEVCKEADARGMDAFVSYRSVNATPSVFAGAPVRLVEMPVEFGNPRSLLVLLRFVLRQRVRVVYLSDRPVWSPAYTLLRMVGVRRIVVHDHTSGERERPVGPKRLVKKVRQWLPGSVPNAVIGVSDFVADRLRHVALVPSGRVHRIWNSIDVRALDRKRARDRVRQEFDIGQDRLVVGCAARAEEYKGVPVLAEAVGALSAELVLVYFGDGPALASWRRRFANAPNVIFAGFRSDARDLMADVDIAAVPSLWAEAFGMAAIEPMERGVPVVASRVGGIPEVIVDGESGILVPPGDAGALIGALSRLIAEPELRGRMGEAARRRVESHFARGPLVSELVDLVIG